MNGNRTILMAVLAVSVLVSSATLRAVTSTATPQANPYEAIVGRNVFGLKPAPPPPDVTQTQKVEPPKLELQGITTILHRRQVLVKVLAKPPQQPKDESYVLDEGERRGELEVLAIDENAGTVKFNNNGAVITLNMKDNAAKPPAGVAPAGFSPPGGVSALPGIPPPSIPPPKTMASAPGEVMTIGASSKSNPSIPTRPLRGSTSVAGGLPAALPVAAPSAQQIPQKPLSVEEQIVMIEVQREQHKDDPKFPPLPPTPVTPNPPMPPLPE